MIMAIEDSLRSQQLRLRRRTLETFWGPALRRSRSTARFRLIMLLGAALFTQALFGSAIPCATASYADYEAQGQCMIGDFTLFGFTFANSSIPAQGASGAPIMLSAAQVLVDPTGSNINSLSLRFSAAGGFNVGAGQFAEYVFRYEIDPVLPLIDSQAIDLGPNDPVTLIGEFCGNGTLASSPNAVPVSCTGSNPSGIFPARLQITGPSSTSQSQSFLFPVPITTEDVRLILDLEGRGTTDGAHVDFFGSDTGVTSGGIVSTGEPSTTWLALIGVLALSCCVARKRLRAPQGSYRSIALETQLK